MSEFESQLRNWYQAEIAGKAFFDALAGGAQSEAEVGGEDGSSAVQSLLDQWS